MVSPRVQAYLANINFADECLGRVLDALDASAYREHTIVILWSDHGYHLGEKGRWSKFTLWEESARCLLICDAPGVSKSGVRCSRPVNLLDMYPSLVELCGLPEKADLDGNSFVPLLRDPAAPRAYPSITANNQDSFSLRFERYRYIRYSDGAEELYDHENDPMEWDNLANRPEHKPLIEKLAGFLPDESAAAVDIRRTAEETSQPKPKARK